MSDLKPTATPRILVVEDDTEMVELMQNMLSLVRCDVQIARSGEEALEVLHREAEEGREIDLVLLDIMVPGMDGYEVVARVKADPLLRNTAIIMTTALNSVSDKTLGLGLGADDYLTKPFDPQELLARIDAVGLCFSDVKLIRAGGDHPRLYGRDLAAEPNIPGHEACLQVVALGERTEERYGVHVGERYSIQADIYVDTVSHAFGYYHRGAMQQYTCLAEEVLDNDRGNCLIPIDAARLGGGGFAKPDLGRAEAALSEPWGCVAAKIDYRNTPALGGVAWAIGATMDDLDNLLDVLEYADRVGDLLGVGEDLGVDLQRQLAGVAAGEQQAVGILEDVQ